jgi:Sec-independent protein secretion pathway component TatC
MASEPRRKRSDEELESSRMTLGEHLDELRRCLVRSILAIFIACLVCIWPSKYLLELIARPVVLALRNHGQPDSFLATSPIENLLVYAKVVVIFGLILAAPYVIRELWGFVAAGLYEREKIWVRKLVPVSVGLFLVGVVFMYLFVLLVSLNFLVGFSGWLPLPDPQPNRLERLLIGTPDVESPDVPSATSQPAVRILAEDPPDPEPGTLWLNLAARKLKLQGPEGQTYSVQLLRDDRRALVTTHFKIGEYLSFVLMMTIAFGAAFQTPLVVVFLVQSGLVPIEILRNYRKVVILLIVVVAGILAPPDLFSHLLLSAPMYLLFELGLYLAARGQRARAAGGPGR